MTEFTPPSQLGIQQQRILDTLLAEITSLKTSVNEIRSLVGPFGVAIGEDDILVQTLQSLKYRIPAHDLVMTPQLVVYRQWEPDLSALLPTLCPPGSVFVDVGANFGYFTCLVAAHMNGNAQSKVVAIEPNPELLRLLRINLTINWSLAPVEIKPIAVGDTHASVVLTVPRDRAANGRLCADPPLATKTERQFNVVQQPLDSVLADEPRVTVLKVDVEGFELAVFRGATETLSRKDIILVFEWSLSQIREAGFEAEAIVGCLLSHGFKFYRILPSGALERQFALDTDEILRTPYANFMCAK